MNWLIGLGILAVVVWQLHYWLVYFPRAWRDGSNREINDIKTYANYVRDRRK